MAYDNTNRWTLNKNDRKAQDNHPDYKGQINIDGVEYWLDGWIKEGANGKFISGSIKPKEARQAGYTGSYNGDPRTNGSASASQQPAYDPDLDDSIPF
jgi:hypothetical protein